MARGSQSTCRLTADQLLERYEPKPQRASVRSAFRYLADCTLEERAEALARVDAGFAADLAERQAERRRPRSLVGSNPGSIIRLQVIQHNQRDNSMLISVDGNAARAKWVPIEGKPSAPGKPAKVITTVYFTARPWEPGSLGFLIVLIPGWLASDRAFTRCEDPQISPDMTWTSADLTAWEALGAKMRQDRQNASKAERNGAKEAFKQANSDERRREERARRDRIQASS